VDVILNIMPKRGGWWQRSSSISGNYSPGGFIVTNLAADNRAVVRFYNKRGTAEQWIKEGKQAVTMTRLSPLPRQ
jgi:hypothetical protein